MKTFICYDNNTYYILAFIRNDYSKIEDIEFNIKNSSIIETELEPPVNYSRNKVVIENGILTGFVEG